MSTQTPDFDLGGDLDALHQSLVRIAAGGVTAQAERSDAVPAACRRSSGGMNGAHDPQGLAERTVPGFHRSLVLATQISVSLAGFESA